MKRFTVLFLSFLIAIICSCTKSASPEETIDTLTKSYLYNIRDGKIDSVYNTMLSDSMKKALTLDDFREHCTTRYKGKVGSQLRTAYASFTKDKATGKFLSATAKTANAGRMGNIMDRDETLKYTVRWIPVAENKKETWKVEQLELMAKVTEDKENKKRLEELLANYKGMIKLEEITATPIPGRKGWAKIEGTILNASEDLDLIKIGVKLKFKDNNGDYIFVTTFYPVIDIRVEGLRTSALPGEAKLIDTKLKDLPENWDPEQPIDFEFYMIDGQNLTKNEIEKEKTDRKKLKKEIEEAKRADEEARRQLQVLWEREKKLKEKIKALKAKKK